MMNNSRKLIEETNMSDIYLYLRYDATQLTRYICVQHILKRSMTY